MYSQGKALALTVLTCCAMAKEMTEVERLVTKSTKCTYEYAKELYGAYCAGLGLEKIPKLNRRIEILEFTDNKLREITAETFSSHTGIKMLYLADNQIYKIDEDAFTALTSLETLDLAKNIIIKLPSTILQLPYLQRLYLSGNPLLHSTLSTTLESSKEIKAPLQFLDVSDCKLTSLPEWGVLPQLLSYNISNNPLESINPENFAMMCSLERVDLTNSLNNIRVCSIKPTITWFQEKKIFQSEYAKLMTQEYEMCPEYVIPATINVTYHNCKSKYIRVETTRVSETKWLKIGGGLAGFLIGFILLLYLIHRHNVIQTRTNVKTLNDKSKNDIAIDNHATTTLLRAEAE